jgi:hypothetical protein
VSPVKYELGFYIPEDDILLCSVNLSLCCVTLFFFHALFLFQMIANLTVVHFTLIRLDGEDLHFFELNMAWKSNYLIGVSGPTERRIWMQRILESLTTALPPRLLTEYKRAGWCYIKVWSNNRY